MTPDDRFDDTALKVQLWDEEVPPPTAYAARIKDREPEPEPKKIGQLTYAYTLRGDE